MKFDIKIFLSENWNKYGYSFAKGNAFYKDELLRGIELTKFINYHFSNKNYKIIKKLNGFFCLIYKNKNITAIASDIIRSFPIFYKINNESVIITDNPQWFRNYGFCKTIDEYSKFEFLLTGYVTGKETLYNNVKQLQAAEIICFDDNKNIGISNYRYYSFIDHEKYKENFKKLLKFHEYYLIAAFERLIRYSNGKKIVIPLSGGYDSRLVAMMLKKLNYNNILAFTFGEYNCNEYKVSKEVAKNLKIDWEFIAYSNKKTRKWYNSEEKKKFEKFGNNLSNVLLDRQFPAVWQLSLKRIIPDNSIFVPGHAADFISGGHIPFNLFDRPGKEDLIDAIINKHYVMWKFKNKKLKQIFKEKIANTLDSQFQFEKLKADRIYENWEWQERQVKLINNSSTRLYEFWNHDWWLPFWDKEYIQFWNRVPLRYKINNRLYQKYVIKLYSKMANLTQKQAKKRDNNLYKKDNLKYHLNKIIKNLPFGLKIKRIYKKISISIKKIDPKKDEQYETDWSKAFGRMNIELYKKLLPFITGRTSCVTLEAIGLLSYNDKEISEEVINVIEKIQK